MFDPFCGCATTLVSADKLGRRWIGIDIEEEAVRLVKERIEDHQGLFSKHYATRGYSQTNRSWENTKAIETQDHSLW